MQSAYRKFHSTKTALVKLFNDTACSIDAGEEVSLVLLDLSSAFDTIDHCILIDRLEKRLGLSGQVISWLESYLSSRQQVISVYAIFSLPQPMKWGVLQGSVLGLLLFSLYMFHQLRIFFKLMA